MIIADGLPLSPVSPVVQTDETLYSVTISWGYVPTPSYAPLLGYAVMLSTCEVTPSHAVTMEISSDVTEVTLLDLTPSVTYCVSVGGWNLLGPGAVSTVTVTTVSGLVPPSPSRVIATALSGGSIDITWQVRHQHTYECRSPPPPLIPSLQSILHCRQWP